MICIIMICINLSFLYDQENYFRKTCLDFQTFQQNICSFDALFSSFSYFFRFYFTFLMTNQSPLISNDTGASRQHGKKQGGRCRRSSLPLSLTSTRGIRGACSGARNLRTIITKLVNLFVCTRPGIYGLSNVQCQMSILSSQFPPMVAHTRAHVHAHLHNACLRACPRFDVLERQREGPHQDAPYIYCRSSRGR